MNRGWRSGPDAAATRSQADTAAADGLHDVVIAGAGPVGLLLAVLLRQAGVDVVLLERRHGPSELTRAIGIHPPSLAVLDRAGLRDALLDRAVSITEGTAGADRRVLGRLRFGGDAARSGAIATLPQPETERLLRERLAELDAYVVVRRDDAMNTPHLAGPPSVLGVAPGASRPLASAPAPRAASAPASATETLRFGVAVVGITQQRGGVIVEVADAASGARSRLRARCVVGADGVHSAVRASAGLRWRRMGGHRRYAMADVSDAAEVSVPTGAAGSPDVSEPARSTGRSAIAELWFERAGVVESFPMPGGRRWVVWLSSGERAATFDRFSRLIQARTGLDPRDDRRATATATARAAAAPPVSEFIAEQHLASRFARGRILLVGDAAHQVSPIGGQGMNLGWLDVAALAPILIDALRPAATRDRNAGIALAAWATRRRRAARRAQRRARFNMAMGAPAGSLVHALRCLAIRLLAGGPWRGALGRAFTMRDL